MIANEQKIKCPKCGESISIDDVLTHQIEEKIRREVDGQQHAKEAEISKNGVRHMSDTVRLKCGGG
jgi:hypothetical protein